MTTTKEHRIRILEREQRMANLRTRDLEIKAARVLQSAVMIRQFAENQGAAPTCTGTVFVNVKCGGVNQVGLTVSLTLGATTVTATTSGFGTASLPLTAAGTWTGTVSGGSYAVKPISVVFACADQVVSVTVGFATITISGNVRGCGNANLPSATVSFVQSGGGVGSVSTNGSGNYSYTFTGDGTSVTITVSRTRFANSVATVTALCSLTYTQNFTMSPATGYSCDACTGPMPVANTLFMTTPRGTVVTLTNPGGPGWYGTETFTATVCDDCFAPHSSAAPITIAWQCTGACGLRADWTGCNFGITGSNSPVSDAYAAANPTLVVASSSAYTSGSLPTNFPYAGSITFPFEVPGYGTLLQGTYTFSE